MMITFWISVSLLVALLGCIVLKVVIDTRNQRRKTYDEWLKNLRADIKAEIYTEELKRPLGQRVLCEGCALKKWLMKGVDCVIPKTRFDQDH